MLTTIQKIAEFAGVIVNGQSPIRTALRRNDFPRLFTALGYQRGAEIGVWSGDYSEILCQGMPGLQLRCVDPWQEYKFYNEVKNNQARMDDAYSEACRKLKPFGCVIDRRTSIEAARDVADGSLDFVYLDGNHAKDYVLEDLTAWCPKVRVGGIVAGHDFVSRDRKGKAQIEVEQAVTEYTFARGISPVFVAAKDKYPSFFWVAA